MSLDELDIPGLSHAIRRNMEKAQGLFSSEPRWT